MIRSTNTKRAILDLAESFLQEKGFNGFSYAHIATELHVRNAAIHYHFPTKEALTEAVIQRYRDRFQLWINNARVKDVSPKEKLDWLLEHFPFLNWRQLVLCGDKRMIIGDHMIDDHARNLIHFPGQKYLFNTPHNVDVAGYRRINNWAEAAEIFL